MFKAILILSVILIVGCTVNNEKITTQEQELEVAVEEPNKSREERRKEVVKLIPFLTEYSVLVGQKLTYAAKEHGSVGSTQSVAVEDENIVSLLDKKRTYDQPENSNMSGGDASTTLYSFEAKKEGTTQVLIKKYFRGTLENEFYLTITVE